MLPGAAEAAALLLRHAPRGAQVLEVDDGAAPLAARLAAGGLHVTTTRPGTALAPPASVDALVAVAPTRFGPLIPFLQQAHRALVPDGLLVVAETVWQTAPTADLLRAYAPRPGGEKVRPIEGFEMQLDHAGFHILERLDVPREAWHPLVHDAAQRAALAGDQRGAAKVATWALKA